MAEVTLTISGRQYAVHCKDGEEAHLAHLAAMVDAKAKTMPGMTEMRLLLFTALFLADDLNDLKREAAGRQRSFELEPREEPAVRALEELAGRLEELAERLVPADATS